MKIKLSCIIAALITSLTLAACSGEKQSVEADEKDSYGSIDTKDPAQTDETQIAVELSKGDPVNQLKAEEASGKSHIKVTGSIVFKDLEGGFYALITDTGEKYTLHYLDETYQKNGLKVEVVGIAKPQVMTITQFGTPLSVISVKVLSTDSVISDKD